jgi:hypothetical protein
MTRTIYFDKELEAAIQARMLREGKKAHQVMLEVLRKELLGYAKQSHVEFYKSFPKEGEK